MKAFIVISLIVVAGILAIGFGPTYLADATGTKIDKEELKTQIKDYYVNEASKSGISGYWVGRISCIEGADAWHYSCVVMATLDEYPANFSLDVTCDKADGECIWREAP